MDETRTGRLDAVEAWAVGARERVDGIKAEMRDGRGGRGIDKQVRALKVELEAQLRELEELSGGSLPKKPDTPA